MAGRTKVAGKGAALREEPFVEKMRRVLLRAKKSTPRARAEALANAGVIRNDEITKVTRRLERQAAQG